MLLQKPAHCELARGGEFNQLAIAIKKHPAGVSAQLGAEEEAVNSERALRVGKGRAQRLDRKSMLGPERTQHMRLDQICEREQRRRPRSGSDERGESAPTFRCRVFPPKRP